MKILLITFSDNADHQDALFGIYEQINSIYNTYILVIKYPRVNFRRTDHIWFVDCPKRPGICIKTFDILLLLTIIKKIKKENFDIIYFESLHVWNIPILLSLGKRMKTYQVIHDVIPHEGDKQEKYVYLMNKLICRVAHNIIIRNKTFLKKITELYKVRKEKVKYLDLVRRYQNFSKPSYSGEILFFGRINKYKGIDNLIQIIKMCPDVKFSIVGKFDMQVQNNMDKLIGENNVRVVNKYVTEDEMRKSFITCSWVILPYSSASQSGVIVDAYKYSRPVIAFNVGAIKEQVDNGKSGFLVDADNVEKFVKILRDALNMDIFNYRYMCRYAYNYGKQKYSSNCTVNSFVNIVEEKI